MIKMPQTFEADKNKKQCTEAHSVSRLSWLADYLQALEGCPLCSLRASKELVQLDILHVYQCQKCRMMFLNPCLRPEQQKMIFSSPELLTRISGFFSDYYSDETWLTPGSLKIYRRVLQAIAQVYPEKGKILDIGCGKGTFLKEAKKEGWEAVGIEPNFNDAKCLRDKHQIEVFQTDFFRADLPEQSLDVISLWDLIEHVPDPKSWIRRCLQILKPGGLLILATPNHSSFIDFLAFAIYRLSLGQFKFALSKLYTVDHTLYFTEKTLTQLVEGCGMKKVNALKVNTDLSRYAMGPAFRFAAESLLFVSRLLYLQNRIILFARKP